MTARLHSPGTTPLEVEAFLSGAYERILRITLGLAVAAAIAAALLFGWRSALGTVIGSFVGYVNLIWLHQGSAMMIERMLAPLAPEKAKAGPPSKLRLVLSFVGRYVFVVAIVYVILKGFPSMLYGFVVALFFPILAAMCEGVYEACRNTFGIE